MVHINDLRQSRPQGIGLQSLYEDLRLEVKQNLSWFSAVSILCA